MTGLAIESEDVDSIGGWLFNLKPELAIGEPWSYADATFIIRERDENRIRRIEIKTDLLGNVMEEYGHS
ncbi:Transporter associated domain protein [compost metagenome]